MKLISKLSTKALTVNLAGAPEFDGGSWWYPTSASGDKEESPTFESYVESVYKTNGIIFACVLARQMPFSEARFQYQEINDGNPGKLVNGPGLDLLANPWSNGTTGELLSRMEQDASLAGNFYATPVNGHLRRLRPDWVTIISGVRGDPQASPYALEAEVLAYIYQAPQQEPVLLTPERVVHYSPIPDPSAQWRGMSWITPVISEVRADSQATKHKLKFLQQGAALNFAITYDKTLAPDVVKKHAALFAESHAGTNNAYKTLHLGGGADPKVIGTSFRDLDFKAVQGAGETRIAAAAGVGAIIARFSEGLAGSSLNTGNYEAAKRQFADQTLRPLWRTAAGALSKLTTPPPATRLWYDTRDVEFLKADRKDAADIQQTQAQTIRTLVDGGYTPESVIRAVESSDYSMLVHSGLYSIQLQAPGGDETLTLGQKVEAAGALVRAGYDPAAALVAVGLDSIRHLGLLPVTLQSPRQLELTPAEADAVT